MGLDFGTAWELMGRDIDEILREGAIGWFFVVLFCSMPFVTLILLFRRHWLALLPLIGWLALIVAWFSYYATDWFGPVSGAVAGLVFLLTISGWVVLIIAATMRRDELDGSRGVSGAEN